MLATWILYHIFCLLSTMNFIFLKFFLIVCFSKTIICDSAVIIPLGVMLVNHKIQIFLIILFVSLNVLISIGMERPLATHVTLFWPHRHINTVSHHPTHQYRTGRNRVRIRPSPNWLPAVELGSVWATLQEGRNYLGCGERRYFQKSCCLSAASSGFLEMVLADPRSPSSFPRRSPARTDPSSTAYVR